MTAPGELRFLNPAACAFLRAPGGVLQAVIDGEEHSHVVLYRSYPLTRPTACISVRTPKGDEIGIISDLGALDADSRTAAERELHLRYLVPTVTRIDRISNEHRLWIWDLQTDRGPLRAVMRNLHEHVQLPASGRVLITDMDGRRCEITSIDGLDAHSRRELSRIL